MSANNRQVGGEHYKGKNADFQHWDLIEIFDLGYLEGCATKYVSRWRKKSGLQDVQKARHYVEKLIELHKEGTRQPRGFVPRSVLTMFFDQQGINTPAERDTIATLCRWRTLDDLHLASQFLDLVEDMARRAATESRPGTPEDGGHHERDNRPLEYPLPHPVAVWYEDGVQIAGHYWVRGKHYSYIETRGARQLVISPGDSMLREMEKHFSPNRQEI